MAKIDIRTVRKDLSEIDSIVFAENDALDGKDEIYIAFEIVKRKEFDGKRIAIRDGSNEYVLVHSVEHAQNMITALQKAIELGWVE